MHAYRVTFRTKKYYISLTNQAIYFYMTCEHAKMIFKILFDKFRLRASEYDDLRGKLQANIENVKNIVVRQSLSELFLEDFRQQVTQNPKYRLPLNHQV